MNKLKPNRNAVLELSIEFSLQIIEYCNSLKQSHHYEIAKQLVKSGTSIGANIWEAQSSESKRDFIHKLKLADKEANETEYWLLLCEQSDFIESPSKLLTDNLLLIKKLLSRIISTSKKSTH